MEQILLEPNGESQNLGKGNNGRRKHYRLLFSRC
jgi:hypothetical protein